MVSIPKVLSNKTVFTGYVTQQRSFVKAQGILQTIQLGRRGWTIDIITAAVPE
jgi:hypothetical protein